MRTTAFALLGVTTAMALGLVAFISRQGWPDLPVAPIPHYQAEHGSLDSAVSLAPAVGEPGLSPSEAGARRAPLAGGSVVGGSNEARLSGPHRASSRGAVSDQAPEQSDGIGAPAPAPEVIPADQAADQPAAAPPAAASSPPPPPAAPTPTAAIPPPVATGNPGRGHAYGRQKAVAPPKSKPSQPTPAPTTTVPAAESPPPTGEPEPPAPAPDLSEGPGNGHGHAYGHDK